MENQEAQPLQEIESITLNKSELIIYFGDEVKLVADITPENTDSNLVWSSSDESIAMVRSNGVLTALYSGFNEFQEDKPFTGKEVNIYCTSPDGKISATCKVTVFPKIGIATVWESNKPFTQF